jgi:GWxTD domain-containing protein
MRKIYFIKKSLLFIALSFMTINAQYLENSKYSGVGLPYFEAAVYRQFAFDKKNSRVTTICNFLYDDLAFEKSDSGGFNAKVKLITAIYNDKDRMVNSRIVEKEVFLEDYDLTNSRSDKVTITNEFLVEPGKYFILLKSIDMKTQQQIQRKIEIDIKDYSKEELCVSDIRLYSDVVVDSLGRIIRFIPAYGSNFTNRMSVFYAAFDIYSKKDTIPATIRMSLINKDNETEIDTTIKKVLVSQLSTQIMSISVRKLKRNAYTIKVKVKTKKGKAESKRFVSFFWTEVPGTEEDIDLAFRQMTYIADSDSLDYYEDKSFAEKQAFFKRYWKRHDPNPDTEKNELQDEFFRRINYANSHFSAFNMPGWKTDRGRIYIKFGSPDEVDRHPFDMDSKPYIIWRYYSVRKEFVFVDVSGFGDYRLDPAYYNVEYE